MIKSKRKISFECWQIYR